MDGPVNGSSYTKGKHTFFYCGKINLISAFEQWNVDTVIIMFEFLLLIKNC